MPHDHGHAHIDPDSGDRRVAIAIWANGLLTVAQVVGGIFSGSLALIADALQKKWRGRHEAQNFGGLCRNCGDGFGSGYRHL